MIHVWSIEEIHAMPEHGWFYGFVRVDGRLVFGEIFPGMGVAVTAPAPWWSPRAWLLALRDVTRKP